METKQQIINRQVFDELVNEVNFLERAFNDALEVIYSRLEKLKENYTQT